MALIELTHLRGIIATYHVSTCACMHGTAVPTAEAYLATYFRLGGGGRSLLCILLKVKVKWHNLVGAGEADYLIKEIVVL